MLDQENDIEHDGKRAQCQLSFVAGNAREVVQIGTIEYQLQITQHASRKVEQYVPNAPTDGRFSLHVQQNLRDVLDETDKDFDVAQNIEEIEPIESAQAIVTAAKQIQTTVVIGSAAAAAA
eukprot:CAMPEP_0172364248 /NCGR_PEP_ID=MMETSP1060-20121228/7425_1 /TAXON_ID=37318 /ORGANISM="Pseudo-nitzschia pungens, Strain cf. cingulata" /LENGTH=120 /DNA_ID=CAMNT_0013087207 /DNA_START=249 /DNA_END=607 /DNA_ORIENTATION=-